MTKFCKNASGLAAAGALLMAAVAVPGHAAKSAAKTMIASTAEHGATLGLIDVQPDDLLQKGIKDNWVSYNGDYTGRRYSSLTQVTPANVSQSGSQMGLSYANAGMLEVTPVVVDGVMFITGQTMLMRWMRRRARAVAPCTWRSLGTD